MLTAIGIDPFGKRRVLGVSVAVSEAEVHWRAFLENLLARGLQGVEFITSDDHPGLKAARQAVLPGARWQRCQFHLAQNAIHHAPNQAIRKAIGDELRAVWDAPNLASAQEELKRLVTKYRSAASKLAEWLENNVPEGLAVFKLPRDQRTRMRTSNPIERSIQQEIKRRTKKNTRLPKRGFSPPLGLRHPGRDRRAMGRLANTLCQLQQRQCRLTVHRQMSRLQVALSEADEQNTTKHEQKAHGGT